MPKTVGQLVVHNTECKDKYSSTVSQREVLSSHYAWSTLPHLFPRDHSTLKLALPSTEGHGSFQSVFVSSCGRKYLIWSQRANYFPSPGGTYGIILIVRLCCRHFQEGVLKDLILYFSGIWSRQLIFSREGMKMFIIQELVEKRGKMVQKEVLGE